MAGLTLSVKAGTKIFGPKMPDLLLLTSNIGANA